MNVNKRQQILALVAVVGVSLLAGERLLAKPLIRLWKDRSAQITQLKQSVEQGTSLLERERVIEERWENMRTNTLSRENSVAENQVLRSFDRWSQDSRIGIIGVKPQWKRAGEDYATLECRVDATGSLAEITRFLYEIEKDPLGFKLDIVEITSRDDRGQQMTLGVQVSALQLSPPMP